MYPFVFVVCQVALNSHAFPAAAAMAARAKASCEADVPFLMAKLQEFLEKRGTKDIMGLLEDIIISITSSSTCASTCHIHIHTSTTSDEFITFVLFLLAHS